MCLDRNKQEISFEKSNTLKVLTLPMDYKPGLEFQMTLATYKVLSTVHY